MFRFHSSFRPQSRARGLLTRMFSQISEENPSTSSATGQSITSTKKIDPGLYLVATPIGKFIVILNHFLAPFETLLIPSFFIAYF